MNGNQRSFNSEAPRRILVRGVNWLGDAVMTTPALLRLRERFPASQITILVPEKLRELWLNHPAVDRMMSFGADEGLLRLGRRLRAEKFDLALVLPNSPRSAIEVWLAAIPVRIGHARSLRSWFLTHPIPPHPSAMRMRKRTPEEVRALVATDPNGARESFPSARHQIHDYLHLVAALGAVAEPLPPVLASTDIEMENARQKFALHSEAPLFALNAGAEYGPAKRWPKERFIAAAKQIQKRTNCHWLVLGGNADVPLAMEISSALGCAATALAGKTSLRELCAILKLSRILLTNDTGPMHVAAALGTPVVVPFGSTSPELTGPGLPGDTRHQLIRGQAPCSPCFLRECPIDFRCMNSIAVEDVVQAVLSAGKQAG